MMSFGVRRSLVAAAGSLAVAQVGGKAAGFGSLGQANRTFAGAASVALSLLFAAHAQAAPTVDQSYLLSTSSLPYGTSDFGNDPRNLTFTALQSATAGLTGQLTEVDLQLTQIDNPNGNIDLSLIENFAISSAGVISGATRSIGSIAVSALPQFGETDLPLATIDTSGLGIFLTSGESFAILAGVSGPDAGLIGWIDYGGGIANAYAGGAGYYSSNGNATFTGGGADYGFRTFVDPDPQSAVPEPASWAMIIGGLGCVAVSLRRRRRVRFA